MILTEQNGLYKLHLQGLLQAISTAIFEFVRLLVSQRLLKPLAELVCQKDLREVYLFKF